MRNTSSRGGATHVHALLIITSAAALQACMLTPTDDQQVDASTEVIEFTGYVPIPAMRVTFEAATSPDGPFSPWPGSNVRASLRPSQIVGGVPYYRFGFQDAIPAANWQGGCAEDVTYVRPVSVLGEFTTFDDDGIDCLLNEITAPGFSGLRDMSDALALCGSSESPLVRIVASSGGTHVGDVVVTNQSEADALSCYSTIDGDLTVAPASTATLSLPTIAHVTGDLGLSLPADGDLSGTMGPYPEDRCGIMNTPWESNISRVDLSALSLVDGDVTITVPTPGVPVGTTPGEAVEVGLDALAQIGGSLSIAFDVPAVVPCGLSALTQVGGDVALLYGGADAGAGSLLSSLATVFGNASVGNVFSLVGSPFPALVSAAGTVTFHDHTGQAPGALFPSLTSAAGVHLDNTSLVDLATLGTSGASLGGLELTDNGGLFALPDGIVDLSPSGVLTIGPGNGSLTNTTVCQFVSDQQALGWTPTGTGFSCP